MQALVGKRARWLFPGLLLAVPPIAWAAGVSPPWPQQAAAAGMAIAAELLAFAFALLWLPALRRPRIWLGRAVAANIIAGAGYLILFYSVTYRLGGYYDRDIGGWELKPEMAEYIAAEPGKNIEDLLADLGDVRAVEQAFTPASLRNARLAVLGSWLFFAAALGFCAVLAYRAGTRRDDPVLAEIDNRLARLKDLDPVLLGRLQTAVDTMANAGNVVGAIVSAAATLEGQDGLLGLIASQQGQSLHGHNLNAQIEELTTGSLLTPPVASDLHWIRIRANVARHNLGALTADDAILTLDRTLTVVEWFHRLSHPRTMTVEVPSR